MIKRILVAIDGSTQSYKAFDFALEITDACKAGFELYALSVVQPMEAAYFVQTDAPMESAVKEYKGILKKLEEKAGQRNLKVATEVTVGHPAETIVKFAAEKNCDLIVMGHRGMSKIEDLFLGSVSYRVVSTAHCTVAIVK